MQRSKLTKIDKDFKNKDIISISQFSKQDLEYFFKITDIFKKQNKSKLLDLLKGKIISLVFYEPSTRTFSSFSAAVKLLGGQTIEIQDVSNTSVAKGETLEDTMRTLASYTDLIVLRHPEKGAVQIASESVNIPVINAGDGVGEHPTQALLDLYTIYEKNKTLDGIKGLIVGDLLNGRTVHSLIKGLNLFDSVELFLLSPSELSLPKNLIEENTNIRLKSILSPDQIPGDLNFWYWTRVQKERFKNLKLYEEIKHKYILDNKLIKNKANKNTIFMHPLPRIGEIKLEVDSDPRALYFTDQIRNGLSVRMSLLTLIFGERNSL